MDEKGRIGGKLNLIDLIIIIIVIIAVVVAARTIRSESHTAGTVDMTFTVLVEGIREETYNDAAKHIPSQLMASGSLVDAYVTDSQLLPHTVYIGDGNGGAQIPAVDDNLVDALFTVEATVPRESVQLNTLGSQEIRIGKIHYLKTEYFEFTGTIYTAEWGEEMPAVSQLPAA